jgi:hypothetical protein
VNDVIEPVDHNVEFVDGVLQKSRVNADAAVGRCEAVAQRRQQVGQRVERTDERLGQVLTHFVIVGLKQNTVRF